MKRGILQITCFAVLALVAHPAYASSFSFNQNCKNAYAGILQLKFDMASKLMDAERKSNPNNDIPLLLQNYIDFFVIMISDEKQEFDNREGKFDDRIDQLEDGDETSPFYRFSIAETRILHAIVKLRYNEYFSAAVEFHRAKLLLEENQREFPRFALNMKWLSVIHILVGAVPDNYKWLADILGYHGNISQGINELQALLDPKYARTEVGVERNEILLLLVMIEANFVNDREATKEIIEKLVPECQKSPLVAYCSGMAAVKSGMSERAVQLLSSSPQGKEFYPFCFTSYQLGIAKMNRLDQDANLCFDQFLRQYKGRDYVKYAYQKMAWCSLLKGEKAKYDAYMQAIKVHGIDNLDEDRLALKEATKGPVPNVNLLKARLLFDGGFYTKAFLVLSDQKVKSTLTSHRQQLEYTYRLGRINQELGNIDQAISCYKTTIDNGRNENCYYAPNSALQLGVIYETLGKKSEAIKYYNMVPMLATDEYRNSLNVKAKAYLNHIENKTL